MPDMMPHQTPIAEFAPNQLNRKNTYQGLPSVEIESEGFRFRIGFWETFNNNNGEKAPYMALIYWTAAGWIVLDKLSPIWNDDITAFGNTADREDQVKNYVWWLAVEFNAAIQEFIMENLGDLENEQGVDLSTAPGLIMAKLIGPPPAYIDENYNIRVPASEE